MGEPLTPEERWLNETWPGAEGVEGFRQTVERTIHVQTCGVLTHVQPYNVWPCRFPTAEAERFLDAARAAAPAGETREYGTLRDRCVHSPRCTTLKEHDDKIVPPSPDPVAGELQEIADLVVDRWNGPHEHDAKHCPGCAALLAESPQAGLDARRKELVADAAYAAAQVGLYFPALCHEFGIPDPMNDPTIFRLARLKGRANAPEGLAYYADVPFCEFAASSPSTEPPQE